MLQLLQFVRIYNETESEFTAIHFAAQPSTNYSGILLTQEIELPTSDTEVFIQLECDIQPGALRQRYSVQWKHTNQNGTQYIISRLDMFNQTLSVNSSLDGTEFQCEVTINHNGRGVIMMYTGRNIYLAVTFPNGKIIDARSY